MKPVNRRKFCSVVVLAGLQGSLRRKRNAAEAVRAKRITCAGTKYTSPLKKI